MPIREERWAIKIWARIHVTICNVPSRHDFSIQDICKMFLYYSVNQTIDIISSCKLLIKQHFAQSIIIQRQQQWSHDFYKNGFLHLLHSSDERCFECGKVSMVVKYFIGVQCIPSHYTHYIVSWCNMTKYNVKKHVYNIKWLPE